MTSRIITKRLDGWKDKKGKSITPQTGDKVDIVWSCWKWKFSLPDGLEYVQQGSYATLVKKGEQVG